jgi:hypothetical protein
MFVDQMRVHILSTSNYISYFFFYPLLVNKRRLAELNIYVNYYDNLSDKLYDCDVLLLDSKHFSTLWGNRDYVLFLLQEIKYKCRKLIWLDSTASTGSTHFQVLPIVDKYLKKQLLKDLSLYTRVFYGARIYTDYYKNHYNLPDEEVAQVDPIDKKYINKLCLSWNLVFGPYSVNRRITNLVRLTPWFLKQKLNFTYQVARNPAKADRSNPVCFRGSDKYTNKVLAFQRIKIIEMLRNRGVDTTSVKFKDYIKELENTKIAISPFGAGELCYRDFEIILTGALLLKPSLDHLVTWPDIFIEGKTYVSAKWDLSDFEEKVNYLLQNDDLVKQISLEAHERYVSLFKDKAQEDFCYRFIELIS